MNEIEVKANIANSITTPIVEYFCTKLAPGADKLLIQDQITPMVNNLSDLIHTMMVAVIIRERQQFLLGLANLAKGPVSPSIPEYTT